MAVRVVLAFLAGFMQVHAQIAFIEKINKDAKTLQIIDSGDNKIMKTQFLPSDLHNKTEYVPIGHLLTSDRSSHLGCENPEKEVKFRNSTYEMKNGKLYKVTRVRKKASKQPCLGRTNTRSADRRNSLLDSGGKSFNFLQKLFPGLDDKSKIAMERDGKSQTVPRHIGNAIYSILPKLSGSSSGEIEAENNVTGDRSWKFWTASNPITYNTISRRKDKLKKLLNLFTIVQFDNEGCIADGLKGTCYHDAECSERGGSSLGPCANGFGVCCYIERTCGALTAENCTYFVNEGFPSVTFGGPDVCTLSVQKAHPDVRQLRLEFETFELQGPMDGTCLTDRFLVTGQNRNSIVPEMCGVNTGQHMYVDVDAAAGPYSLSVVTMGQSPGRKWRVKVTQLLANSDLLAPRNCLQYFTDLSGVIESFNYQQALAGNAGEATPGYFNNLNYDACVRKAESFCSVTYTNQATGEPDAPFQLINMNEEGGVLLPRGQAGAEIFNCPDDYIIINGVRLCGDRLNDATIELDYTKSAPVTDISAGPAQITVHTDQEQVSKGFRLYYKQNPCLNS